MLQSSNASQARGALVAPATASAMPRAIVQCVDEVARSLGCAGVWARTTGPYVLLGLRGGDAFARLTALGGASYGLAFRAESAGPHGASPRAPLGWDPLLLIDELAAAIEHALVGVGAGLRLASSSA